MSHQENVVKFYSVIVVNRSFENVARVQISENNSEKSQ
jgi:hypothetical protein